jgi:thioredoxin reductase
VVVMQTYDVIVIGAGAAGLSAALLLSRAGRTVAVIDGGAPRNAPAAHLHGYLSRDGLPPLELLGEGRREVTSYGARIVPGQVTAAARTASGFEVTVPAGETLAARRLLVATGLRDELPAVEGLGDYWGDSVVHCPYCHGHEVRDEAVGVLGSSRATVHYAQLVRQWARDVVLFTDGYRLTADERESLVARAIGIVDGSVARVVTESGRLAGVELADGTRVPRTALFAPPRFVPQAELLVMLGADTDADGWPVVDASGRTTVSGLWAAGNVTDPSAQVITAASAGAVAAAALNGDLVDDDVRRAVAAFRGGYAA